jgi:hypothetical protein
MTLYETTKKIWDKVKYPIYYTAAFTASAGTTKFIQDITTETLEKTIDDTINISETVLLGYALTNLVYANAVNYATKKFGKVGGYAVYALTNIILGAITYAKSDTDPTMPLIVNAGIGAYLTRNQINSIERSRSLPTLDIPAQGI